MFANLNTHSYFSFLNSTLSLEDIVLFAKKNNSPACLIDFSTMHGAIEFYKICEKENVKPVIGLQIKYQDNNIFLIAQNFVGYKNLLKVSSCINTNEDYDITKYLEGLIVIADSNISWTEKFYLSSDVAIQEAFYLNEEDAGLLKIIRSINSGSSLEETPTPEAGKYLLDESEAKKIFSSKQLATLEEIINSVDLKIVTENAFNFPRYDAAKDSSVVLQELCMNGLSKRLNTSAIPTSYNERLKYELSIINAMKYNDYFLVVQDYVNWAKSQNILVGPGRGSAAGSLISYVLGITDIDPLKYNLIFERFLNIDRKDKPDIDIDFPDTDRQKVLEYLYNRYSKNNVAHVSTFQTMKAKSAIRDIGKSLGIDPSIINLITKEFNSDNEDDVKKAIESSSAIKSYSEKYPELFKHTLRIIGFPRQIGTHASAVVISLTPLNDVVPLMTNSQDSILSTQYAADYLEKLGLVKVDLLSLSNLTTIQNIISLVKTTRGESVDIFTIPLDDKKVFSTLSAGETSGIFQLSSPGITSLTKRIKPTSIQDISTISALFRPGANTLMNEYIANRQDPSKIKYLNDNFKSILLPTYGVIIYQEQLMEIVKVSANYTMSQADAFRKIISKKNKVELLKLEDDFKKATIANGYSAEQSIEIFKYIERFASYGFNMSHSISYSYVSYWLAYLKCHYPQEFFAIFLSSTSEIGKYLNIIKTYGISIFQPSINTSQYGFTLNKQGIVMGFNCIKGIGNEIIKSILNLRDSRPDKKFSTYIEAIGMLANNSVGEKTIESLILSGAFDELLQNKTRTFLIKNIHQIVLSSKTMLKTGEMLIKPVLQEVEESTQDLEDLSAKQFALIGVSFNEHPTQKFKKSYNATSDLKTISEMINKKGKYTALVLLKSFRSITTKTGLPMAMGTIEDETGSSGIALFPAVYSKFSNILKNGEHYIMAIDSTDRGMQALKIELIV